MKEENLNQFFHLICEKTFPHIRLTGHLMKSIREPSPELLNCYSSVPQRAPLADIQH